MVQVTCQNCGRSRMIRTEIGYYVCQDCGIQSQDYHVEEREIADAVQESGRRVQRLVLDTQVAVQQKSIAEELEELRKSQAKSQGSLHILQVVLQMQINALERKFSLPITFREWVRELWFQYLKLRPHPIHASFVAHELRNKESEDTGVSNGTVEGDAYDLTEVSGKKHRNEEAMTKKRSREESDTEFVEESESKKRNVEEEISNEESPMVDWMMELNALFEDEQDENASSSTQVEGAESNAHNLDKEKNGSIYSQIVDPKDPEDFDPLPAVKVKKRSQELKIQRQYAQQSASNRWSIGLQSSHVFQTTVHLESLPFDYLFLLQNSVLEYKGLPQFGITLALCYAGLILSEYPMLPVDLLKMAEDSSLPYLHQILERESYLVPKLRRIIRPWSLHTFPSCRALERMTVILCHIVSVPLPIMRTYSLFIQLGESLGCLPCQSLLAENLFKRLSESPALKFLYRSPLNSNSESRNTNSITLRYISRKESYSFGELIGVVYLLLLRLMYRLDPFPDSTVPWHTQRRRTLKYYSKWLGVSLPSLEAVLSHCHKTTMQEGNVPESVTREQMEGEAKKYIELVEAVRSDQHIDRPLLEFVESFLPSVPSAPSNMNSAPANLAISVGEIVVEDVEHKRYDKKDAFPSWASLQRCTEEKYPASFGYIRIASTLARRIGVSLLQFHSTVSYVDSKLYRCWKHLNQIQSR